MNVPKIFIYVGAETEEAWKRIGDEIAKILASGRAGEGFREGCVLGGSLEKLLPEILNAEAITRFRQEERNVYILMRVRALSQTTAKKVGERLMGEMGAGKLDPYFLQFKASWSANVIDERQARKHLEEVSRRSAVT
jgi:tRNA nucleotidyltransferase/poly(A) polymerase